MAEPPFSGLEGSLGGAHRRDAPKTLRSEEGFETRGTREEKYTVVPRKLRRAGHQRENCMQIPQKAVKWV